VKRTMVAIVDDDELIRQALDRLMRLAGFKAQSFALAEEFLHSGVLKETGCLVSDIRMPGMSGIDLQKRLKEENERIPIIFITAHGDAKMCLQALRDGAVEFLSKPFNEEDLLKTIRAALES
jgi:FixJ family two-component response regulator